MAKPKLILLEDGYQLVCGDRVSELASYGEPAELEVGDLRYLAYIDEDEDTGEMVTPLDSPIYTVYGPVEDVEIEDRAVGESEEVETAEESEPAGDGDDESKPEPAAIINEETKENE